MVIERMLTLGIYSALEDFNLYIALSTALFSFNGRRKRTLHLYVVTATNLGLLRANAETSHSVRTGPGGGCGG